MPRLFTINGIFNPVIVKNGQVIGVWKRTIKKDTAIVTPAFFEAPNATTMRHFKNAAKQFGRFIEKKIVLNEEK